MAVWFLLALMTGACVMALLWPLSRRARAADAVGAETAFYEDQLAEIDRDAGRGLIQPAEAEAARAEAGRRLLRACRAVPAGAASEGEPALRRRRAAAAFSVSTVPLVALVAYGIHGSPELPSRPAAARSVETARGLDLDGAVARIEAHLGREPNDGRGWELLAPIYLRGGRVADAARATGNALRLLGETPTRLADHGEALVAAADGLVTAEARDAFDRAVRADAALPKARFYLARAAEQDGDRTLAAERYERLAADAPADAPWLRVVRERIAALGGTPPAKPPAPPAGAAEAALAALPEAERAAAIRGMVEGLDRRLADRGGTAEEWARLVRAYGVLGEPARAEGALARARTALAADRPALARLDREVASLGPAR